MDADEEKRDCLERIMEKLNTTRSMIHLWNLLHRESQGKTYKIPDAKLKDFQKILRECGGDKFWTCEKDLVEDIIKELKSDPLSWITDDQAKSVRRPQGRPRTIARETSKSSQNGLPEGWTRATFIVREDTLEKVKDLAHQEQVQIKQVINEALEAHLKGKRIKRRPERT